MACNRPYGIARMCSISFETRASELESEPLYVRSLMQLGDHSSTTVETQLAMSEPYMSESLICSSICQKAIYVAHYARKPYM
eukprot:2350167-Rhodomonas_salina.2